MIIISKEKRSNYKKEITSSNYPSITAILVVTSTTKKSPVNHSHVGTLGNAVAND